MNHIYLGIDLGTSSVKIIAMTQSGDILGESTSEYPVSYPHENWAEQDPDMWWEHTQTALLSLLGQDGIAGENVKAIGFSGQMHGLVALGADKKVITPAMLWCDQRTFEECDIITKEFGSDQLLEHVSNQALTGFTAPKLLWLKRHQPEIFNQIEHIMLPKDYIRFKLTGVLASDLSDASGTLLLDVQNKEWSKTMCDYIGIKMSALPALYESYEVTGTLLEDIAHTLKLSPSVKVVGGAGDQAAGAVGSGAVKNGIITATLGTSGVIFAAHDAFSVDDNMRLHAFCHANGRYHSMGVMLSAANSLKWWTDQMQTDTSLDVLLKEAEAVDVLEQNVIFTPYLMGERTPYADPYVRGSFLGLGQNNTRGNLTRAILEGVAFGLKDSLTLLTENNVPIEEIRVIGGGSKSDLWLSILANIFGYKVSRINTNQGGALGAAILAAVGDEAYASVEEAADAIIKTTDTFEPNEAIINHYSHLYTKYQSAYKALYDWHRL